MNMKNSNDPRSVRAFTLLELLVVIVVILILAAMLLPVFQNVRAKGKLTSCTGNLAQFGYALAMYRDDYENSMPGWLSNLVTDYGVTPDVLVCPQDYSEGHDGGRPSGKGGSLVVSSGSYARNAPSELDKYGPEDYGIDIDNITFEDKYCETDDTKYNQNLTSGNNAWERNDAVDHCSYMYEFAGVSCSWTTETGSDGKIITWNKRKEDQMRETKDGKLLYKPYLFPSVRCFYHWGTMWGQDEYVMNTAYEGSTFASRAEWEKGTYE